MQLKCLSVIDTFKDVFVKGDVYEATPIKNELCDVTCLRNKRNGTTWTGVLSLGLVVVLGVAKFEIIKDEA